MPLVTKGLNAGSDQQQPIHHRELKRRNWCYFGKSISTATIALAYSIFPARMGPSSDIAKHWRDGVCLLGGRKEKSYSRPPFSCQRPQGTANPRVFLSVAASLKSHGRILLSYLHVPALALHLSRLLPPLFSFHRTCPSFQLAAQQARARGGWHWSRMWEPVWEAQEPNWTMLPPCRHGSLLELWVSSSSTSAAPCNMWPSSHGWAVPSQAFQSTGWLWKWSIAHII